MNVLLATHISLPSARDALTPRIIACAVLLSSSICLANMYFSLQAGIVNAMPMQSSLFRFAFFNGIQPRLSRPLSPIENTFIEIIAGAIGPAPFTSGFTSFIPALEFLATTEEKSSMRFGFAQLLLWSIVTCGLGILAGATFRNLSILRERLRYPSATAIGTVIGVLFKKDEIIARAKLSQTILSTPPPSEIDPNTGSTGLDVGDLSGVEVDTRNEVDTGPEFPSDDSDQIFAQDENVPAIAVLLYSIAESALFVRHGSSRVLTKIGIDAMAESPLLLSTGPKATAHIQSHCCQRLSTGF
jgi:uncharacterized oligopeptide transporter (OPT) family protein